MKASYVVRQIAQAGASRKDSERMAVMAMIRENFGEDAILRHTEAGAPYLQGAAPHISISHSRHYAALAWADGPDFGIDIEEPRPRQLQHVASRFLTPEEIDRYAALPCGILRAWTLKEAAFKALKTGPADLRLYSLPLTDGVDIIRVGQAELRILESRLLQPDLYMSIVAKTPEK